MNPQLALDPYLPGLRRVARDYNPFLELRPL